MRQASLALAFVVATASIWTAGTVARADRPAGAELLPATTVAYIQVADVSELIAKFKETSAGRIGSDPKIKPLFDDLYGSANEAFAPVEKDLGMSLDHLLGIPSGEITFGIVAVEEGPPAAIALLSAGDGAEDARKLIARGVKELDKQGAKKSTESIDGTKVTIHKTGDSEYVVHFEKDGTFVGCNNIDVAKQVLARWNGDKEAPESLANHPKFTTVMKRARPRSDEPPQLTFFVDPIELVSASAGDSLATRAGLAALPALGLDGLHALGGSITLATEDFDSIVQVYLMLDSPRNGVLAMLALDQGDMTPEDWVPENAANYVTLHWDVEKTYNALSVLYDSFRGQDAFQKLVGSRLSEPLGIDFEKDFLLALDGRMTYVSLFEKPIAINSESRVLALKLKDAKIFQETLDKLATKFPDRLEAATIGTTKYYAISTPRRRRARDTADAPERPEREEARRTRLTQRKRTPCAAIVGDYLMVSGHTSMLETVIRTKSGDETSLADQLDYKLIANKIKRLPGGKKAGLIAFNRPEEGMRMLYDLANSENTRTVLSERSESNRFFGSLHGALKANPLPPFEVFRKYLAPGGGMLISDQHGLRYTGFSLRRE